MRGGLTRRFPRAPSITAKERLTKLWLLMRRRQRNAYRFIRSRTLSRPALLRLSRQRKRRGGAGLFVRHSLKRPGTSGGKRNLLFPPVKAYTRAVSISGWGGPVVGNGLLFPTKRKDKHPLF